MDDVYGITKVLWETPEGWDTLLDAMAEEVNKALAADGINPNDYVILQIKEKFGELCYYDNGHGEATKKVLEQYYELSRCTCCKCGKPAEFVSLGWIEPWCATCKQEEEKRGIVKFRAFNADEREECGIC